MRQLKPLDVIHVISAERSTLIKFFCAFVYSKRGKNVINSSESVTCAIENTRRETMKKGIA